MMKRAVVLLLGFLVVACVAHPKHHRVVVQEDEDDTVEDLERGVEEDEDENAKFEEEADQSGKEYTPEEVYHTESTDPEELLMALDCGSSGTKLMIFAKSLDQCPAKPHESWKECEGVKIKPTMSKLDVAAWNNMLAPASRIHHNIIESYKNRVKWVMAYATAGNRIISAGENHTAWNGMVNILKGYAIDFVGSPSTIPGTHEAFLEFKAVRRNNFFSMGGASAQAGFILDHEVKVDAWYAAMAKNEDGTNGITPCNNQRRASDYFTAFNKNSVAYSPISLGDMLEACKGEAAPCVGLMSYLGIGNDDDGNAECKNNHGTGRYHLLGGVDQGLAFAALKVRDDCWNSGEPITATGCAEALEGIFTVDSSSKHLKTFVTTVQAEKLPLPVTIIAVLKKAVGVYQNHITMEGAGLFNADINSENPKTAGGVRFALFGVHGLLVPSGIVAMHGMDVMHGAGLPFYMVDQLDLASADWIKSLAAEAGFGTQCTVYFNKDGEVIDRAKYPGGEVGDEAYNVANGYYQGVENENCETDVRFKVTVSV